MPMSIFVYLIGCQQEVQGINSHFYESAIIVTLNLLAYRYECLFWIESIKELLQNVFCLDLS